MLENGGIAIATSRRPESFADLKAKYPDTFSVVYTVDKADSSWKGPSPALAYRPQDADSCLQVRPAM